jgi:hypothetical protein
LDRQRVIGFRTIVRYRCLLLVSALLALADCAFDESGVGGDAGAGVVDAAPSPGDARADAAEMPDAAQLPDASPGLPDAFEPADATPTVDSMADEDSDGIADDVDNCPSDYNPEQYDEDDDGHGDVCDNCPSVFNDQQRDELEEEAGRDADGVGDACDPRPIMSGDSIAFFDGFNGDTLGAEWSVSGVDSWSVSGGRLRQTAETGSRTVYYAAATFSRAVVQTEITAHSMQPPSGTNQRYRMGLLGQLTPGESYYHCVQVMDGSGPDNTTRWRLLEYLGGFSNLATATAPWSIQVGVPYSLWMAVSDDPAWQVCRVSTASADTPVQVEGASASLTSGYLGVTTSELTASLPYVVIYALGPPA